MHARRAVRHALPGDGQARQLYFAPEAPGEDETDVAKAERAARNAARADMQLLKSGFMLPPAEEGGDPLANAGLHTELPVEHRKAGKKLERFDLMQTDSSLPLHTQAASEPSSGAPTLLRVARGWSRCHCPP